MEIGRIEAVLSARFDRQPFDKYDRAIDKATKDARKPTVKKLDVKADTRSTDKLRGSLKGVDDQGRRTDRTNQRLGGSFRSTAVAAAKGAIAAGALFAAYKAGKDAISVTADFAKNTLALTRATGMSNQEASRWVAITQTRGLEGKAFGMSMTIMSKQIVAANAGTEKSVAAFKALGVSQKMLREGNISDILLQTSDGLEKMGAGADRNAVASQVLGRGYLKLFPLLTSGSKFIREELQLAGELGAEIGGKGTDSFKKYAAAQRAAKMAQLGLQIQLGEVLMPLLTNVVAKVSDFIKEWRKPGGDFQETKDALKKVGRALGDVAVFIKDHQGLVAAMLAAWVAFKIAFVALNVGAAIITSLGTIAAFTAAGEARGTAVRTGFLAGVFKVGVAAFVADKISKWFDPNQATAWDSIKAVFSGNLDDIKEMAIRKMNKDGLEGGNKYIEGIKNGISGAGRWVWNALKDALNWTLRQIGTLAGKAKTAGMTLGRNIVAGVTNFVSDLPGKMRDWIRGAVSAVSSKVAQAGAAARDFGRKILTGVVNFVNDLPGKIRGLINRVVTAVSNLAGKAKTAAMTLGRNIVNGIVSGIKAAPGAIIQAIKDALPSSLRKVAGKIPGFAAGGKVGPSMRGAQFFVAGEGGKDEWVISQEGDRRSNIGWAVEALEKLTGKRVSFFKHGAKIDNVRKKMKLPKGFGSYAGNQLEKISRLESAYSRQDREYNVIQPDFLTSNDDGSVTVNAPAIKTRLDQLDQLTGLRQQIKNTIDELLKWIATTRVQITKAVKALKGALKGAKGKKHKKDREAYKKAIESYEDARSQMDGAAPDLLDSSEDSRIDLLELGQERAEVAGMRDKGEPADPTTPDTPGTPDTPDPGTPAEPAPTPPTAEEIARAAAEQVASFQANRASLFAGFGQNFIGAGGTVTTLTQAAGLRFFGGGQTDGGGIGAAGGSGFAQDASGPAAGGVTITNNYAAPPPDPHTWSQGLAWEIRTAV